MCASSIVYRARVCVSLCFHLNYCSLRYSMPSRFVIRGIMSVFRFFFLFFNQIKGDKMFVGQMLSIVVFNRLNFSSVVKKQKQKIHRLFIVFI